VRQAKLTVTKMQTRTDDANIEHTTLGHFGGVRCLKKGSACNMAFSRGVGRYPYDVVGLGAACVH